MSHEPIGLRSFFHYFFLRIQSYVELGEVFKCLGRPCAPRYVNLMTINVQHSDLAQYATISYNRMKKMYTITVVRGTINNAAGKGSAHMLDTHCHDCSQQR